MIISVTEGDDKLVKYPDMFYSSQLCNIKIDLLPHVQFNVDKTKEYARRINPNLEFVENVGYHRSGHRCMIPLAEK